MKKTFIKKGIFACIAAIIGIASSFAQTVINTGAVSPASVCAGGSVTVAYTAVGTVTAGTTFSVELSNAAGVFPATPNVIGSGTTSPLTAIIPAGSATGAGYKVRVSAPTPLTLGTASADFTVNAVPAAPTVASPVNYLVGATAVALTATGTGLKWYTVATDGTALASAPVPSTVAVGTISYYVSQTVGTCESPRAKIDVVVACATVAPTVVTPVNYTVGATAVALTATGTALKWYTVATDGTALASAPVPSTAAVGTISYYVSQTVGGCEGPRAKIDVVVSAAPCTTVAPTVTTPVNYTVGATAVALTATGTALKWYTVATDGTALASAPVPSTAAVGTISYYVSQTVGGCEGPRAKIDVVVSAAPCTTVAPTVTTPVNYTVGATAVALTATGTALKWYTVATDGTALASAPVPSTAAVGTISYYVSQTVGGCEGPRAKIDVVVSAEPCTTIAPTVTTPVNYTVGATAVALTATGTALKWYTVATDGTALASAPVPSTAAVGTISYYVSQTVGGCEGPRAKIDVVVSAAPCTTVAPTVTTPVNYTVGATAVALTATGTALKWYTVATDGTALASAPVPSTAAVGTTSYYVSQTVGGCEGPRAKIDVVISAAPCTTLAPTVTTPVNYTVGATAVALTATGTALKWYTVATDGTALASAPVPSTAAVGTTSYYVSQTLGGCEGPRAKIDVVVGTCTTVAPTVVTPVNYTVGAPAVALTATGTGLKWYTVATNGTAFASAPVPSTAAVGTTPYYVSQTLNGCEGPRAKIDVVVSACTTVAPTVVSPVNYTVGATAVALTATGTALKWYTVATDGTALASAPVPSTAAVGTISYYVSQTVGGCEGPRAKIDVVVSACATLAPTVANVTYCLSELAVVLTATGTGLKWYTVANGGTVLTATPTPTTTVSGTTSYYVSQTLNGCEGPRAKLDVIVKPQVPGPTVTATVQYCLTETATSLTATGTGLKWYTVATGGTALAATPTPSTTASGTVSYYVSQTVDGCEGLRAKIDVIVNPQTPLPTVGVGITYCFNETATALTATGTGLKWYSASTGGPALGSAPVPSTATAGTTSYYVSQTLKGCEGLRAKIDVIVKPQISAPVVAATPIEYCQSGIAIPLTATASTGSTLSWYGTNASGGTSSPTPPTPSTETGGTTSYYVNQTDIDGCISPRAKIDVKINVTPKPTLSTSSVEYCLGATASPLSATGDKLKWYLTLTDTNPRTSPLTPFTEKVDDYSFYVTQTGTNTCESAKAEIKIHIKPLPSATISGNSSIALGQTATINVDFTGDAPWKYILSDGQTASTNNANLKLQVSPAVTTSYVVTEVSNTCGKGIQNGVALVTVLIPTITTGIPSVSQLCGGKAFTVEFQQSGDFPTGNTFAAQISTVNDVTKFVSIPSTVSGNILTATLPDTTKGGNYFIRVVSEGKGEVVPGSVSPVKVMVAPLPVATISGPANIYMGEIASLKIALTGDGPWTLNLNDGAKDTLISTSTTPLTVKISPKTTSIYKITTISNACGVGRATGTFRVQVDPVLGTEPPVAAADWLKIYPTMIENKCTVEITSTLSAKEAVVEIFDLGGRSLSKKAIRQKITEVDFSQKPSGMYLLKVQNGDRTSVQRIFKP